MGLFGLVARLFLCFVVGMILLLFFHYLTTLFTTSFEAPFSSSLAISTNGKVKKGEKKDRHKLYFPQVLSEAKDACNYDGGLTFTYFLIR